MASPFFDWGKFKTYYFAKSKYAKKENLARAFHSVWYDVCGTNYSLGGLPTWGNVKYCFNAANKKKMKAQLIANGFTAASVDGLYKALTEWLKANS